MNLGVRPDPSEDDGRGSRLRGRGQPGHGDDLRGEPQRQHRLGHRRAILQWLRHAGCGQELANRGGRCFSTGTCSEHGHQHDLRDQHQRQHGLGDRRVNLQWLRPTLGAARLRPPWLSERGRARLGVNRATDTIYVGNSFDGTVSVVDGRRCNGTDSSGCNQTSPAMAIGSPSATGVAVGRSMAVDPATDTVYLTSVSDSDVVAIDGGACRAGHTKGCRAKALKLRTGGFPINIALDEAAGTLYVADNVDSNVSFFRVGH